MDTINCIILDIFEFLEILDIQSYLYTHVIRRDHIKYFYQKKKKMDQYKYISISTTNISKISYKLSIYCI